MYTIAVFLQIQLIVESKLFAHTWQLRIDFGCAWHWWAVLYVDCKHCAYGVLHFCFVESGNDERNAMTAVYFLILILHEDIASVFCANCYYSVFVPAQP